MQKLAVFTLLFLVAVTAGVQAKPLPIEQALQDRVMGDPDAPITIIEYASLTCPHCARFHVYTLPELKANWLDTGRAKLVFRDLPTAPANLALALAMIARCAPEDRYFPIIDALYENQQDWKRFRNALAALDRALEHAGVPKSEADACMADEALYQGLVKRINEGQQKDAIRMTPSFVINGKVYTGAMEYEEIDRILRASAQ